MGRSWPRGAARGEFRWKKISYHAKKLELCMTIDKCMYKLHVLKGLFRHKRRLGEGAEVTWMGWMFSTTPPVISLVQDLAFLLGGFNSVHFFGGETF